MAALQGCCRRRYRKSSVPVGAARNVPLPASEPLRRRPPYSYRGVRHHAAASLCDRIPAARPAASRPVASGGKVRTSFIFDRNPVSPRMGYDQVVQRPLPVETGELESSVAGSENGCPWARGQSD